MPGVGEHLHEQLPELSAGDPWPLYRELLDKPPFVSDDGTLVVVSRPKDCLEVLRNPKCSVERGKSALSQRQGFAGASFIIMDPPDHTRLRGLVTKAFTRRAIDNLEGWFREEVDRRLDGLMGTTTIEVISEIARPLPLLAISTMLGIPEEDRAQIGKWAEIAAGNLDDLVHEPRNAQEARQWRHSMLAWRRYMTALADERRRDPKDDLLSALVLAEEQGDQLTNTEVVRTVQLLFAAGHETTLSGIGSGARMLVDHPELAARVAREESFAAAFAEEVIRQYPPVQYVPRIALEDLEIGGITAREGALIVVLLGAANVAPQRYDEPESFRPDRADQRHLSFGSGIHFCLGAPLARMETRVALQGLARRLVNPRVSADGRTRIHEGLQLRGYEILSLDVDEVLPAGRSVYE